MLSTNFSVDGVPGAILGALQDNSALLGEPAALKAQMAAQGYLYLRGALARDAVLAARREVAERLIEVGEIRPPASEAIATGTSHRREVVDDLGKFWRSVSEGPALRKVTHNGALSAIGAALFGETSQGQDFIFLRAVPKDRFNGTHCDSPFFTRQTEQVVTFWIPFGDVPLSDGTLYIIEDSHRFDDLNKAFKGFDVAADKSRRATLTDDPVALAQQRGSRLLTANFEAGDVLAFSMYTWHGSFANRSPANRVRLSVDVRYQPASAPRDPRYWGADPGGTTGAGYGELNAAKPLTDEWHIR